MRRLRWFIAFLIISGCQPSDPPDVDDAKVHEFISPDEDTSILSLLQIERLDGRLASDFGLVPNNYIPRSINETSLELISHFEGWRSTPYPDPRGFCTIGFGHLITRGGCSASDAKKYAQGLTVAQGKALLLEDIRDASFYVERSVTTNINDDQYGALVSFVYNLGASNFQKSKLLNYVNDDEHVAASAEFKKFVYAGKIKLSGLVRRRTCEAALYMGYLGSNFQKFENCEYKSSGLVPESVTYVDVMSGKNVTEND